jgi:predicted dinucleotide-binding enzyme
MRIGVIGAGWLGGTVGRAWVAAGHDVMLATRHPDRLRASLRDVGPRVSAGTALEAARHGEAVLIAVPYRELTGLAFELADELRDKVVLDACNPYPPDPVELRRRVFDAGVALVSAGLFKNARLVRAFSAVDAVSVEQSAGTESERLGVPIAGDDDGAIEVAARLVRDARCVPVLVGNLAEARSFQRGGPGFRANTTATMLRQILHLPQPS